MKRINNINKLIGVKMGSYMNMIDDTLIKPSTYSNLQESYFQDLVNLYKKDLPEIQKNVKALMNDPSNVVYFKPQWNDTLSIDEMKNVIAQTADNKLGIGIAWDKLALAKTNRQRAIDDEDTVGVSTATARQRVDGSISKGSAGKPLLTEKDAINNAREAIKNIKEWVDYQTVADAYVAEINRREKAVLAVNSAIEKGDLDELNALKPKLRVKELETRVDDAIKKINAIKEEEARAKAEAEAKAKEEEEARKRIAEAKTPEELALAQAKLDALMKKGSEAVKSAFSGKTLLFVGIGIAVLAGAYFYFKNKE